MTSTHTAYVATVRGWQQEIARYTEEARSLRAIAERMRARADRATDRGRMVEAEHYVLEARRLTLEAQQVDAAADVLYDRISAEVAK